MEPRTFPDFIIRTFIFALSVLLTSKLMPGIEVQGLWTAILVALVYGLFNFMAYVIFGIISLPFGVLTLGIGFWFINTILLMITHRVVDGFIVHGWIWAAASSLVITILNGIMLSMIGRWER